MTTTTYDRPLPTVARDRGTKALCSSVLVDEDYAREVHASLCVEKVYAVAPSPGIDLVLLARYAAWVHRRWLRRDVGLVVILVGAVVLAVADRSPVVALEAAAGAIALAWLWRLVVRIRILRAATNVYRPPRVWDPGDGMLRPTQEDRLRVANSADLSIYSPDRSDPFPGLGVRLYEAIMTPIDVSRPKAGRSATVPFEPSELHRHLVDQIPRCGSGNIDTRNVVHVAGQAVAAVDGLLPTGRRPPVSTAPPGLVSQAADESAEYVRSYVRAQLVGHGGALVTTLNVRIRLEGRFLSCELVPHVLGPLTSRYRTAYALPRDVRLVWWAARGPSRTILTDLVTAPAAVARGVRALVAERLPPRLPRLREGELFDYGAIVGRRERAAGAVTETNQRLDARDQFQRLVTAVYTSVVGFLDERDVDVSDLVRRQQAVIDGSVHTFYGNLETMALGATAAAVGLSDDVDGTARAI